MVVCAVCPLQNLSVWECSFSLIATHSMSSIHPVWEKVPKRRRRMKDGARGAVRIMAELSQVWAVAASWNVCQEQPTLTTSDPVLQLRCDYKMLWHRFQIVLLLVVWWPPRLPTSRTCHPKEVTLRSTSAGFLQDRFWSLSWKEKTFFRQTFVSRCSMPRSSLAAWSARWHLATGSTRGGCAHGRHGWVQPWNEKWFT